MKTVKYCKKLVKKKYPDAVLKSDFYAGYICRVKYYWIEIESIHFTTERKVSNNEYPAWVEAYLKLSEQNLL